MDKEILYRMSYYQQMSNVSGEIIRMIRLIREGKSRESIDAHFWTAIKLLVDIFHDPKNEVHRKQIQEDVIHLAHYYFEDEKSEKREEFLMDYCNTIDKKYIEELRNV